jgi:hypothetical protein
MIHFQTYIINGTTGDAEVRVAVFDQSNLPYLGSIVISVLGATSPTKYDSVSSTYIVSISGATPSSPYSVSIKGIVASGSPSPSNPVTLGLNQWASLAITKVG